jgi:glycosyltransferase involved in cell wall biosynthesis
VLISILIPAYARPEQLGEALQSIAQQDRTLIGEIIIGDDSPRAYWARNQAVIAASGLADLIDYIPSEPARGTYPNQWFLASRARFEHLLLLHNDDQLCPGALSALADACARETDSRVKLWFGTHLIMDEAGVVDPARSEASDRWYGRQGPAAARPVWQWCLTESIPPNAFLVEKATYLQHMRGEHDGNVGDWAFSVRLANSGGWARFIAQTVSRYRVQAGSVTTAGRGVDVHRAFELACQLRVPPEYEKAKRDRFFRYTLVVAVRYARDGERAKAWRAYLWPDVPWRRRLTARSALVLLMLLTPRPLWRWALHYKN